MNGIVAYGAYLPYFRLDRKAIGESLGASAGSGTRSVASYDEDTTSMAVEAARVALRAAPDLRPGALYFATSAPGYLDKTNASAIHAALALDWTAPAFDMLGSVRSGAGALSAAIDSARPTLATLADIRTGLPGGGDEREGGDGAVAFLLGDSRDRPVLAEPMARASATAEFLERWRLPGDAVSRQWEERFGEHAYVPLGEAAVSDALKQAGISAAAVKSWIVTGPHSRASRRVAAVVGAVKGAVADDLSASIGNTGTAHAGLMLADALDRAKPDELIAVVSLADGCDVTIWRTTAAIATRRPAQPVAAPLASGGRVTSPTFLRWRGFLPREPPRRPDPERPAAPPMRRHERWKLAFVGSRCTRCQAGHLPPQRVCVKCGAVDQMRDERFADTSCRVATYTLDHLAYSLQPPVVAAFVDYEGGGRFSSELTDVDPREVAIGNHLEMTFRRLFTAQGVHNYFWKARPGR